MMVISILKVELKQFFFAQNHEFTKEECMILQSILEKLDIKSYLKLRNKINNRYRIRISKTNMERVIYLVKSYMHKDFLYKL
jgi:hypothetical protein